MNLINDAVALLVFVIVVVLVFLVPCKWHEMLKLPQNQWRLHNTMGRQNLLRQLHSWHGDGEIVIVVPSKLKLLVCTINGLVILVHNITIYFPMLIPCNWLISYCTMVLLSLRWCISLTFRVIRHQTITPSFQ